MSPDETAAAAVTGGSGRMVYRAMREDPAGDPMVGPSARTLGVRPDYDIPVTARQVRPNTGGMSVAPDHVANVPRRRRPPAHGGLGKDPVWCMSLDDLGAGLVFRQDSPTHGLIEPAYAMLESEYQQRLADTRPFWKRLP